MSQGHSRELLVAFVHRVRALADEIGDLQDAISEICKEAKGAGFEPMRIREVVRWLRKIDKYGRERVDAAEAIFDLYRQTVDGRATGFDEMMDSARDRALLKIFAPDDQVSAKINQRTRKARDAITMARAAKAART